MPKLVTEKEKKQKIEVLRQKHKHIDYGNSIYVNSHKGKIEVYCTRHNISYGMVYNNLIKSPEEVGGCLECLKEYQSRQKLLQADKKLEEDKEQNKTDIERRLENITVTKIDYILGNDNIRRKYVWFNCSLHGEQKETLYETIKDAKYGCSVCAHDAVGLHNTKERTDELLELIGIHQDYIYLPEDFEFGKYKSVKKFKLGCYVHTEFETDIHSLRHSQHGCPKCSDSSNPKTEEEVLIECKEKHPHIDYSLFKYTGCNDKFTIGCIEHGYNDVFKNSFLRSVYGCPDCGRESSSSEEENNVYKYLLEIGIDSKQIKKNHRPRWMNGQELDIYIPHLKVAIEYNGSIWHHSSTSDYISAFNKKGYKHHMYHYNKWKLCKDNNVTLLSVYDFLWIVKNKQEIYKAKIKYLCGKSIKLYGRKCVLKEIKVSKARQMIEQNHLEGYGVSFKNSKAFGLYAVINEIETLVMCITVGEQYQQNTKQWKTKVHRVCTLKDYCVVGGLSKLIKHIKSVYKGIDIVYQITLATGGNTLNSYTNYRIIAPRYYWVKSNLKYYTRYQCQKSKLEKEFNIPLLKDDTEVTYMERLGYLKVFDNGLAEIKI